MAEYSDRDTVEKGNYENDKMAGTWLQFNPGNHLKSQPEYKDDNLIKVTVADSGK